MTKTIVLEGDLHRQVKIRAAEEGLTVKELVNRIVRDYFNLLNVFRNPRKHFLGNTSLGEEVEKAIPYWFLAVPEERIKELFNGLSYQQRQEVAEKIVKALT